MKTFQLVSLLLSVLAFGVACFVAGLASAMRAFLKDNAKSAQAGKTRSTYADANATNAKVQAVRKSPSHP